MMIPLWLLSFLVACGRSLYLGSSNLQRKTMPESFLNHWHCVAIKDKVDLTKPFVFQVGEMPLVMWSSADKNPSSSSSSTQYLTTINLCKHMGSKLDHAQIVQGCLKCPYHGLEMDAKDSFGETVEHEGKLFWSLHPVVKTPPSTPFYYHKEFVSSILEVTMPCSLQDSAMNAMDIRHPEYVHNNLFGFGSNIPASNIRQYEYKSNPTMIGLSFEYQSQSMATNGKKLTSNFHMYYYPSFTWSRVEFEDTDPPQKKALYIGLHLLPLEKGKTKWFVTVNHNYNKSPMQKEMMKGFALSILTQDYFQMMRQSMDSPLKQALIFDHVFQDEDVLVRMNQIFNKHYKFVDMQECLKQTNQTKQKQPKIPGLE